MAIIKSPLLSQLRNSRIANIVRSLIPERIRPIGYLNHLARQKTDCKVINGPFAGLNYITGAHGSTYIPKLLGIYERELYEDIESIICSSPTTILDLGAAEGYYAVGFAFRLPAAKVIAFEMNGTAQNSLRELAALNDVSQRVEVRGYCDIDQLREVLVNGEDSLVICDVEGHENTLLDPKLIPQLLTTRILVELHDFIVDGTMETIRQRFEQSHEIKHIWQEELPRSAKEFPWRTWGTSLLPKSYLDWSVSEMRPVRMSWFWMVPRQSTRNSNATVC